MLWPIRDWSEHIHTNKILLDKLVSGGVLDLLAGFQCQMIQLFTLSEILSQSTEKFQNKLSSSIIFQNKRQVGAAKLDEGWIMENGLFLCRDWETLTNVREIKTKPLIVTAAQQFWKLITQFVLRGGAGGPSPAPSKIHQFSANISLFVFVPINNSQRGTERLVAASQWGGTHRNYRVLYKGTN